MATYKYASDRAKVDVTVSLIAFLIAHTVASTVLSVYVLQDPDTYWHIRTGNWILENATLPKVDPFSHTAYGTVWIANDWLADIIFATAFNIASWRGVVQIVAFGIGITIAIIFYCLVRILRFSVAIGWATITALLISPQYLARPIIFSFAIMVIWMMILLHSHDSHRRPSLVLIPLMVLWANIHGGFTIGLVFLYIFTAFSFYRHMVKRRFAALSLELCLVIAVSLAALATPYGIYSILITPKVLEMKFALQHISEWRSPDFREHRIHLFYLMAVFAALMAFGVRVRGARLPTFVLMMYLGFSYLRGLIQFVLLIPILLAHPVAARAWYLRAQAANHNVSSDPVLQYLSKHRMRVMTTCLTVAMMVTVSHWSLATIHPPGTVAPQAALEFVKNAKISGNVFNSYDFGGYLIFSGIPTAIDGRAQPFGDAFFRRYSNAINVTDIADVLKFFDEYHISWAILQPTEPLSRELSRSATWQRIYADEHALVFLRLPQHD